LHISIPFGNAYFVCTLAIYFRVFDDHPIIVAANRDEHYDRPSAAPAMVDGNPKLVAGKDLRAGGTWLGANEHGLIAAILNRRINGQPLPAADARSRGRLCLDLLRHESGASAGGFLDGHTDRYNPFTAVFGDLNEMYASYNREKEIVTLKLDPGLHVFSSAAEFDLHSAKAVRAYSLFAALGERARPRRNDSSAAMAAFQSVLADHSPGANSTDPGDAICVHRETSGTVSSSVIFFSQADRRFDTYHCPDAPCRGSFGGALQLNLR
jgi:uncharacterized protein with NRDE domain